METATEIIARIKSDLALLESIITEDTTPTVAFEPGIEYKIGTIGLISKVKCVVTEGETNCVDCARFDMSCYQYVCSGSVRKDKTSIIFKPI